jgi:radical SAM protein (TIGR04043 family)
MNELSSFISPQFITELQSQGLRLEEPDNNARRGGAGPSDLKAVTIDGRTVMIPIFKSSENESPFVACTPKEHGISYIRHSSGRVIPVSFPRQPRFYDLKTADGIPYSHIATLHSSDVLATTILQSCIRYSNRKKSCQFCAIGQSLEAGRTILRKTPQQLAEVARAAVELDGVKQMIMTTGTPNVTDRGAAILCESAKAVKAVVNLPIQGQCEPPDDDVWFERMKEAGIDSLGMHLEVVTPEIRARIMPSKAEVPLERYMSAFDSAVSVFGRGEVSTYILAGLGDTVEAILSVSEQLIDKGVYPFVVPFVPIIGTPLENHPSPTPQFMQSIFEPLGAMLKKAGLRSSDAKAGCAKCGACSALPSYEV